VVACGGGVALAVVVVVVVAGGAVAVVAGAAVGVWPLAGRLTPIANTYCWDSRWMSRRACPS